MTEQIWALGLMSGTSLDGIDAALIKTDGQTVSEFGPSLTVPYAMTRRDDLRHAALRDVSKIEHELTLMHAEAVNALLDQAGLTAKEVRVVGFHGQTIRHRPEECITWQIGDGSLLAEKTGIDVICDFRRRDIAAGGQGAPLVPLYHAALAEKLEKPVAILNIGGIANVTWIGKEKDEEGRSADRPSPELRVNAKSADFAGCSINNLLAFDTGPGNAMLNDWVHRHTGKEYDADGRFAIKGTVDDAVLQTWLAHPFFKQKPPKSLDRNDFTLEPVEALSLEDGAATLTAFTARSIAKAAEWFPEPVTGWYVTGGGRHNPAIMSELRATLPNSEALASVEQLGWDGDMLEAQAFAFLAVRSLKGWPLTLPTTTGVSYAVTGGAFYRAAVSVPR